MMNIKVKLEIRNQGHIPAIKNSFHAIVKPENRQWKKRCVESFAQQLLYGTAITEFGTPMRLSPQSLIAWLPHDDRWQAIPETHVFCEKCEPGEEGATILIERL